MTLVNVFLSVIVPIFALIGVGTVMDRCFRLDLPTLAKLNFHVFVPALLFVKMLEADIDGSAIALIAAYTAVHITLLYIGAWCLFSWSKFRRHRTVLSAGAALANVGNYGIPLTVMAFGEQYLGVLAVVIMAQNLITYTIGLGGCGRAADTMFWAGTAGAGVPAVGVPCRRFDSGSADHARRSAVTKLVGTVRWRTLPTV